MSQQIEMLVAEARRLTGAPLPALLAGDAPVLVEQAGELYLIGLIGGKDVGKSTLVNALAGETISTPSSFGPGTATAIAYVHRDAEAALRKLLNEVSEPIEFRTHAIKALRRQVLLDLPDIDSHYESHGKLTRRLLRHILFPIWIQSVEKYADRQPQQLLAAVAEGNDPGNFLFCLNKADQLKPEEADELKQDFSARIARVLKLPGEPKVWLISAQQRDRFDLPQLRETLQRDRSTSLVQESAERAATRRSSTLLQWLTDQNLQQRATASQRSLTAAEELAAERLGRPLLEEALPKLVDDPAQYMWLTEPALSARLARWPLVSALHGVLGPVLLVIRSNLSAAPGSRPQRIDAYFNPVPPKNLTSLIQRLWAQLSQSDSAFASTFASRPLWEESAARSAADTYQARLDATLERQRDQAIAVVVGPIGGALLAPLRWLLTIGVLIWFPLAQPLLSRWLNEGLTPNVHDLTKLIVPLLGASYLLQSAGLLVIWFLALWAVLVWRTQRRVRALFWKNNSTTRAPDFSLSEQTLLWIDELLDPLRAQSQAWSDLSARVDEVVKSRVL